ncbi:MAG: hypothetical protein F6J96_22700 [Symploca sp. SIO1C2]|nr:hypothetical protein [Symploca sp. SIO1C2]
MLLWAALVGTAGKQGALPSRISSEPPKYLVQEGRRQEAEGRRQEAGGRREKIDR